MCIRRVRRVLPGPLPCLRVQGLEFRVYGLRFMAWGLGFPRGVPLSWTTAALTANLGLAERRQLQRSLVMFSGRAWWSCSPLASTNLLKVLT